MKNVKEAMSVADEKISDDKQEQNIKKAEVPKKKFYYWLCGIALSMLPLLALPLKDWITGENNSGLYVILVPAQETYTVTSARKRINIHK